MIIVLLKSALIIYKARVPWPNATQFNFVFTCLANSMSKKMMLEFLLGGYNLKVFMNMNTIELN